MYTNTHHRDYITDYLIPVINLMKRKVNHTEAFKEVAKDLLVTKQRQALKNKLNLLSRCY